MGHVEREFLTPAETGRILGLGEQTVLMHTRAGNLPGTNVARPGSKRERWRYTLKDIEIFRQRRAAQPPTPTPTRRAKGGPVKEYV